MKALKVGHYGTATFDTIYLAENLNDTELMQLYQGSEMLKLISCDIGAVRLQDVMVVVPNNHVVAFSFAGPVIMFWDQAGNVCGLVQAKFEPNQAPYDVWPS
jgi:hypothetical protein